MYSSGLTPSLHPSEERGFHGCHQWKRLLLAVALSSLPHFPANTHLHAGEDWPVISSAFFPGDSRLVCCKTKRPGPFWAGSIPATVSHLITSTWARGQPRPGVCHSLPSEGLGAPPRRPRPRPQPRDAAQMRPSSEKPARLTEVATLIPGSHRGNKKPVVISASSGLGTVRLLPPPPSKGFTVCFILPKKGYIFGLQRTWNKTALSGHHTLGLKMTTLSPSTPP